MILNKRVEMIGRLGEILKPGEDLDAILAKTEAYNPWFTKFHTELMLQSFRENFFIEEKIQKWLSAYEPLEEKNKTIGLVLAGNVPFVGMHDLISVLASGNKAKVKLSSKDLFLFPYMIENLSESFPEIKNKVEFVERLENFDAVIATGSNNSARYFEYYFGKYPHIIRKNRTSIAILTGDESEEELHDLGKDVFYYFGLGCRNVGKIYLPEFFEPEKLFRIWDDFNYVMENNKYKNNYDYNRALLLLNQAPHLANDFFMMVEQPGIFSPLASVYYEYYSDRNELDTKINAVADDLQCVVTSAEGNTKFGQTQFPGLMDYADHVDTMAWLKSL